MKIRVPAQQETDGDEDVSSGWLEHPFTKRMAVSSIEARNQAFNRLVSACKQSGDPKVVAILGEYLHECAVVDFVTGKWGNKE